MTATTRFARTLLVGAAIMSLSACSRTIRIRDLLDKPQEYDGKTVQVEGTVTQSAGVLGTDTGPVRPSQSPARTTASGHGHMEQAHPHGCRGTPFARRRPSAYCRTCEE